MSATEKVAWLMCLLFEPAAQPGSCEKVEPIISFEPARPAAKRSVTLYQALSVRNYLRSKQAGQHISTGHKQANFMAGKTYNEAIAGVVQW